MSPPASLAPDRSEFAIDCAVGRFRDCPRYQRHAIAG